MNTPPTIGIVDDEPGMRTALGRLLGAEGFLVRSFGSAREYLNRPGTEGVDCLVLDVSMPGLSGLDLQDRLNQLGAGVPVVFLSGQGDIPMTVRAMRSGAITFLTKPVRDTELLDAIHAALAATAVRRREELAVAAQRSRLHTLTPRELEVLRHVISGKLNKQIAADLGTSEQTVKVHRMRLTAKLGMTSVADLVRLADRLGIDPAS